MAKEQRVVILTRGGREHRHVTNVVSRSVRVSSVLVESRKPVSARVRAKQLGRRYTPLQLAERAVLRVAKWMGRDAKRRDRALRRVLGPSSDAFADDLCIVEVPDINGQAARTHLDAMCPDMLLVYGTGIVRDSILGTARVGALNMHTGLSPEYRGSDCAFWPVHDQRFDLLGATVHECTSEVDGGVILAQRHVQLQEGDGLHEIFARCVRTGADLYAECAAATLRIESIVGTRQDLSMGREYRSWMRGIRPELRARLNLRSPVR